VFNTPAKTIVNTVNCVGVMGAGLKYFSKNHSKVEMKSVAFPKLGTNNGGLDGGLVKDLMEKYLSDLDLDIYICLNEKNEADGTEKKMLDLVNKADREHLIKEVGINAKQAKIIVDKQPVHRFWQIINFNGIGKKSYEKLFRYYYQLAKGKKRKLVQMALEM
jgi:hypothetical protein